MRKNYIVSPETKIKISQKLQGIKFTQERIKNISAGVQKAKLAGKLIGGKKYIKGHIPWNKGKNGVYSPERMEQLRKEALNRPQLKYGFLGKKHTEETKKIIGIKNKNRTPSLETRVRIGNALRGNKSSLWKGGIDKKVYKHYKNLEYRLWREKVFKRDNFTCQFCGYRSGSGITRQLHPHHIKSYTYFPELRYLIKNGITLCIDCHYDLHYRNSDAIARAVLEYAKSQGWIEEEETATAQA